MASSQKFGWFGYKAQEVQLYQGSLLCRSIQLSKEDNWLCSTISPSRWYTGQLWQSRTSSPAALTPPNLHDLNLLLPGSAESWRMDTFKFHISHCMINSLHDRAWIQNCTKQTEMLDAPCRFKSLCVFKLHIYMITYKTVPAAWQKSSMMVNVKPKHSSLMK